MELNTRGRYAVMAMADLAKHGNGGSVPLSAVAQRQQISLDYLEQLFLKLRRAGLVESLRGRHGGYKLGRPAADIYVAEIMNAVEEGTRMTRCFGEQAAGCLGESRCLTHNLWTALGDQIETFLASVSLNDVVDGMSRFAAPRAPSRATAVAALETGLERPAQ
ncbi:MAG: Rrf2 family transcriptional regulator [Hyphomicrobium zavarzinii]|uniref:Rrf2 family transcriptional regulator n=1 Tax=Hyphomicrobium zavarzinii TaxID=48292 RepID=UPI00058B51EF|nr:Rrf2 family transcriptional regulator [Hyphomicrobium zavarzinii]MBL8847274.1 Rrf2 family transcriptional regulator [Hyphomicrobium zavarzinii]HML42821.1 Rrf2 family transcriptional regulator [Hyphomicrobium zavarzinii]